MEDKAELERVAMQIILNSGDARSKASDALRAVKTDDFRCYESLMSEAVDFISKAHMAQTDIIQKEAEGHCYPYSILFAHAQDTMMTVDSEIHVMREIVDLARHFKGKE